MSERLGVDVWNRGLGEGWSIKDAFDNHRPFFESLGTTWPVNQVGTPRVRVAGQLIPPIYVGYRLAQRINSGPVEYVQLYTTMWPTFTTRGSQVWFSHPVYQFLVAAFCYCELPFRVVRMLTCDVGGRSRALLRPVAGFRC